MIDRSDSSLTIPNATRVVAALIVVLIFCGGSRTILITGEAPLLLPVCAAGLSVIFLFGINVSTDPVVSLARIGFHVGLFAYFLSFPVLYPETIEPGFSDGVHQTVGWMLIFSVLGFEGGYHARRLVRRRPPRVLFPPTLTGTQRGILVVLLCVGLAAWFLPIVDYSSATRVSTWDLVLSMRGRIEGGELGQWSYLLTGGLYLADAAAFLLVTSRKETSITIKVFCWAVMMLCSVLGFLSGSRSLFLYCFAPLALSAWVQLIRLGFGKTLRVLVVCWAVLVVGTVWVAMSAIRGQDVRSYEGILQDIRPAEDARGAFDIYSSSALIVQSFPQQIDYEYGKSLIPLVFGWVPRSVWPDKPYPFSVYANTIQGETLDDRSASIAVGLSGEGYGNFGLFGVLLWGILMGLACCGADSHLRRFHPSNPLRLFLGVSISIWAAMIVRGGVAEMFYMGLQVNMFPVALSFVLKLFGNNALSGRPDRALCDTEHAHLRLKA
jgi:hypothetical protein